MFIIKYSNKVRVRSMQILLCIHKVCGAESALYDWAECIDIFCGSMYFSHFFYFNSVIKFCSFVKFTICLTLFENIVQVRVSFILLFGTNSIWMAFVLNAEVASIDDVFLHCLDEASATALVSWCGYQLFIVFQFFSFGLGFFSDKAWVKD